MLNILVSLGPYRPKNVGIGVMRRKMLQSLKLINKEDLYLVCLQAGKALPVLLLMCSSSDATAGKDLLILGR